MTRAKTITILLVLSATALSFAAWARLAQMWRTKASAAQVVESKDPETGERRFVHCRGNAIYHRGEIWQFPCSYKEFDKSDLDKPRSRRNYDTISSFSRWNVADKSIETGWRMPELENEDERVRASDYTLFAFAPHPEQPAKIVVGLRWRHRNFHGFGVGESNEGREKLYFYLLQPDKRAQKFGQTLEVQRSEVGGVGWNGDRLEVVVRQENGAAELYGSTLEGSEWSQREIRDDGCGKNQKCRLEMAFQSQNQWQFVRSRVARPDFSIIEFWQNTENAEPVKFAQVASADSDSGYSSQDKKDFVWFRESFDAAPGNVLARDLSARAFRLIDNQWQRLEPPRVADYLPRFTDYSGGSYYRDGSNFVWFPTGTAYVEGNYEKEFTLLQNRWFTGFVRGNWFDGGDQQTIKLRDAATNDEQIIVGAHGEYSDWFDEYAANAMPLENGELLLFNSYGDHVRVDQNLRRVDPLSAAERYERMTGGNFVLFGSGVEATNFIYYNEDAVTKFFKRAAIPLILHGLPALLLIAGIRWIWRRKTAKIKASFWTSAPARNAAIGYLAICVVFGYYFWKLSAYF